MASGSETVEHVSRVALKLNHATQKKLRSDPNIFRGLLNRAREGAGQGVRYGPLINSVKQETLQRLVARAQASDPTYVPIDFNSWYLAKVDLSESGPIEMRDTTTPEAAVAAIDNLLTSLRALDEVESAHALRSGPPPVDASDDPKSSQEGYLDAAPGGIDARYAWTQTGGDGSGVGFVDMEQGWDLSHEDLVAQTITLISGTSDAYFWHGTSVLGEVLMADNAIGGIGIAPKATGRVVSQHQPDGNNIPAAIISAVAVMQFGDVLLLEAQENDPAGKNYFWPVEIVDATYDAIRLATALGIVVVEAGCNGSYDLDPYTNADGKAIFNRSSADFRDSGAIMVGAASSASPHSRLGFSNYGSRIDVYAWGENITTATTNETGTDNTAYTSSFNGTSGASPIVSGAAILVQSIAQATRGGQSRFSPLETRRILQIGGTASSDPTNDRIGVMPDLKAVLKSAVITTDPDVYIRDYVGDTGDPTSGALSASPDIILRQAAIADPTSTLGAGSGNENNAGLSQDVISGRDHYLYLRGLNRGTNGSSTVTATAYYSPPATLLLPSQWHPIGSTTLPSIPMSNTLTVFNGITWPAVSLPTPGHYCFIATLSTDHDPAPALTDLQSWDNYIHFISNNNNVAWHNFDVVSAPPESRDGFRAFGFQVPGAWDRERVFSLETLGSLPDGSLAQLVVPLDLAKRFKFDLGCCEEIEGKYAAVPLVAEKYAARDWQRIGGGVLEKGFVAECGVRIRVPESAYGNVYEKVEFAVRQMYQEFEVGRLTWRFGQSGGVGLA